MAIAFARPEYVGRSDNKNACCKSSYNSRSRIIDQKTGKAFNFINHGGNVYHNILLPEYVDKKLRSPACCRHKNAIFSPHIHGTWEPYFSPPLYSEVWKLFSQSA